MDSEGEDYYDSDVMDGGADDDTDDNVEGEDYNDSDGVEDDDDTDTDTARPQNYTILNEEDILKLQENAIAKVCSYLYVSRESACILLLAHNWNVIEAQDAWFDDEEKVCKALGILKESDIISLKATNLVCGICFEIYESVGIKTTGCGHPFCNECWTIYISTSISDGPGCLSLRCPHPSCGVAVGASMLNILVSNEDKKKYDHYLLRSYIERNIKRKWCPAPGCDVAVQFDMGSENYDVSCKCSYKFCWNCTEEIHRPVSCETVSKWILKNSAESENTTWILANSKPCPKCKRPIEKNHGCMHMTCSPPCRFHFCWLCLEDWSTHGAKTGGFYACNRYETAKQQGAYDKDELRREMAKMSLERYTHYYERWSSNQSSRLKASADLNEMQTVKLAELSKIVCLPETNLDFVIEAWQQIVECRRVLTWTYAYGYYIPDEETVMRQFFEYLQGDAESALERLHHYAEKELQSYLTDNASKDTFSNFKMKLAGLTSVTRTYFQNLVKALENGFLDMDTQGLSCSKELSSTSNRESSKAVNLGETSSIGGSKWACDHCTFLNPRNVDSCSMCALPRS